MAKSKKNNSKPTQFCLVGEICYSGQFTPAIDRLDPELRDTQEECADVGIETLKGFLKYEEAVDKDDKIVPGHIDEGSLDSIGEEGNDMYDRAEDGKLGLDELVNTVKAELMKGNEVEIDMEGGGMLKLHVVVPRTSKKKPETPKEPEGGKKFRITYRSEIYITAANEEEAREKFEALDLTSKEGNSRFVEEVSFEPQD
jgi:hypothetical protein